MIDERAGGGVGKDDRRLAHRERRLHGFGRDMAQIDEHAEPVHFPHHLDAERRQAMMRGVSVAESAQSVLRVVRQRHIARAEVVHLPQHGEGVVDLMAAFDADQRGDLSGLVDAAHIGGGVGDLEIVRIARRHALHQIDLLEGDLHRFGPLMSTGTHTDQNCPPTRPARRRGISVMSGGLRPAAAGSSTCRLPDR